MGLPRLRRQQERFLQGIAQEEGRESGELGGSSGFAGSAGGTFQARGAHEAIVGGTYLSPPYPDPFQLLRRDPIFIAEHGSWNRSTPVGYRIMLVTLEGNRAINYTVFAKGWLQGSRAWGRPVDLLVMPDGSLLLSDDRAGVIYRIWYRAGLSESSHGPAVPWAPLSFGVHSNGTSTFMISRLHR